MTVNEIDEAVKDANLEWTMRRHIKQRGLTIKDFAPMLDISVSTMRRYLTNPGAMPLNILRKVIKLLDIEDEGRACV